MRSLASTELAAAFGPSSFAAQARHIAVAGKPETWRIAMLSL
jgi:hypothetical protein